MKEHYEIAPVHWIGNSILCIQKDYIILYNKYQDCNSIKTALKQKLTIENWETITEQVEIVVHNVNQNIGTVIRKTTF